MRSHCPKTLVLLETLWCPGGSASVPGYVPHSCLGGRTAVPRSVTRAFLPGQDQQQRGTWSSWWGCSQVTQQTAKPLGAGECRGNSAVPLSSTRTVLWCSHHASGSGRLEGLTFDEDRVDFDCSEHREWILYLMKTGRKSKAENATFPSPSSFWSSPGELGHLCCPLGSSSGVTTQMFLWTVTGGYLPPSRGAPAPGWDVLCCCWQAALTSWEFHFKH